MSDAEDVNFEESHFAGLSSFEMLMSFGIGYLSSSERTHRNRFVGHLNAQTGIKEANFLFGDRIVACGSDDGCVYLYDARTSALLHVMPASFVRFTPRFDQYFLGRF